jgi:hypothetical protein
MARKIILETGYTFSPSTKTVVIPRIVDQERLVLITNVTKNKVIYNFSDASLLASSFTIYGENQLTAAITSLSTTGSAVTFTATNSFVIGQNVTVTGVTPTSFNISGTITAVTSTSFTVASTVTGTYVSGGQASISENTALVLNYNTTAMSATDKLQFTIDEYAEKFEPSAELTDPVGKFRTSTPQALIDTDFEYGPQTSKWENLGLINNQPFAYQFNFNALNVASITAGAAGTKGITVAVNTTTATVSNAVGSGTSAIYTTSAAHGFSVNQLVTVGSGLTGGSYATTAPTPILSIPSSTTFIIANATAANTPTSGGTATVTAGVVPAVGTPIYVVDTFTPSAVGNYIVESRVSESSFTYTAKGSTSSTWASANIFDPNKTLVSVGTFYTGTGITATSITNSTNLVTVTTSYPHGLHIGNEIAVIGTTASTNAPNGNFTVTGVSSPNVFTFYATNAPTGTITTSLTAITGTGSAGSNIMTVSSATNIVVGMIVSGTGIAAGTLVSGIQGTVVTLSQDILTTLSGSNNITLSSAIFPRSQAQVKHRAFDGGVFFSTNGTSNNVAQVRQTRRYFRYQSGKGIQISSGTILKPTYGIDSISYSSPYVTITTKEPHGLQPGYQVTVYGANEIGYNGTFTVTGSTGINTFTYVPSTIPLITTASGNYYVSVSGWNGAANRLGLFDQQNGVFFEYDGTTLYAVRRSSIFQTAGRVSVTQGSTSITASSAFPTTFTKQLIPGDYIAIRGQSYKVTDIISDTSLTIQPAYRGPTASNVIVSKTIDTKIPQSQWNIDKMDGTGPSGYNIDLTKMQMFYMDYSWYGAGAVRWGFRGPKGNIIYVHKQANNNQNATAYMRSGNLAGRYESVTSPATTQITASVGTSDTTINVGNTYGFYTPTSATQTLTGGTSGQNTVTVGSTANILVGQFANGTGIAPGAVVTAINTTTNTLTLSINNTGTVSGTGTFQSYPGAAVVRTTTSTNSWEYINYTGLTSNTLTGVTRGQAGATAVTLNMSVGSNIATVTGSSTTTAGLQVGMRVIHPYLPDGTKIEYIPAGNTTTLLLSTSPTVALSATAVWFPAMGYTTGTAGSTNGTGVTAGQAFTYSATAPVVVEQAYPTFGPSISHWGTSVIMDGRFDDDKSLLFTYGQTTPTILGSSTPATYVFASGGASGQNTVVVTVTAGTTIATGALISGTGVPVGTYITNVVVTTSTTYTLTLSNNLTSQASGNYVITGAASKALMSIRIAPSVDNGFSGAFGTRELLNKMQLQTKTLDISLIGTTTGNVLVQAYLNGISYNLIGSTNTSTVWTNAVRNAINTPNSSLAQIADYSGSSYVIQGGEVTGGFFVYNTGTTDISQVRDLGNAVLAGGSAYSNTQVYPDGPDTLTIVVTNVGTAPQSVLGRISWTEAQA